MNGEPWSEYYRPETIKECILPDRIKEKLESFIVKGSIPNFLFFGTSGTGKTTSAIAIAKELGVDYLYINASLESNIDTLRVKIKHFASSMSLINNGRKIVILDEGDYMSRGKFQPALRGFMQDFSKNCAFIITCNYKHKIIEPLHSRCINIDFSFNKSEYKKLMGEFFNHTIRILDRESIKYDKKVISNVIKFHFPDFRRILNELEGYSSSGIIDSGILSLLSDSRMSDLITYLKEKDWSAMRIWVENNSDIDPENLYKKLYDMCDLYVDRNSRTSLILILNNGDINNSMVSNKEINTVATLTYMMRDLKFI